MEELIDGLAPKIWRQIVEVTQVISQGVLSAQHCVREVSKVEALTRA